MLAIINNENYIVVNTYNNQNLKYLKELLFYTEVRFYESGNDDTLLLNEDDIEKLFNEYVESETPDDYDGTTAEYWEDKDIYAEQPHDAASAAIHLYMYLYSN